jgi:hypothetical protein
MLGRCQAEGANRPESELPSKARCGRRRAASSGVDRNGGAILRAEGLTHILARGQLHLDRAGEA